MEELGKSCTVHSVSGLGQGSSWGFCVFVSLDLWFCPHFKLDFIFPPLSQQDWSNGFSVRQPKISWFFYEK